MLESAVLKPILDKFVLELADKMALFDYQEVRPLGDRKLSS